MVPRAGLARARAPRRGRVRASGDHGEACVAVGVDRRGPTRSRAAHDVRSGDIARSRSPRRRTPVVRDVDAASAGVGSAHASGSVPDRGPSPGSPTTLVWADEVSPSRRHDGSMVLAYHVLWELVHVCFEHPGLLRPCARRRVRASTAPASRARTRAGSARSPRSSAPSSRRCARRAGVEEVDTTLVDPARRPGRSSSSTAASPSRGSRLRPETSGHDVTERTDFLYPFIEGNERDAGRLARRSRAARRSAKS